MRIIQRILMPEIFDVIAERFGDVAYALTTTSFFYGGAVRDFLAEKPLKGDLDIVVGPSYQDIQALQQSIEDTFKQTVKRWSKHKLSGDYADIPNLPVSEITIYSDGNRGVDTQAIVCGKHGSFNTVIDDALEFVASVDLVCCGVAVDCWGFLYEMVPGAISDCKGHIVRPNLGVKLDKHRLEKRLEKFVRYRGWKEAPPKKMGYFDWENF